MAVNSEQLPALLTRSLAPVYLVAGSEPLLIQECRDQVIHTAQQQGFAERKVFDVIDEGVSDDDTGVAGEGGHDPGSHRRGRR